jgi:DedD protein
MDEAAKRRLAGAAVLVALAVIFVPMLVDDERPDGLGEPIVIPEPPEFDERFDEPVAVPEDALEMGLPVPEPPDIDTETPGLAAPPPPALAEPSAPPAPKPETKAQPASEQRPSQPPAPSVTGPKPVPPGTQSWVIQVASLGSPEAARGLQDELRGKGYPAFIEQARVNGKLYYRVRVGPEIDRARADGIARRLANETGAEPLVQRYP